MANHLVAWLQINREKQKGRLRMRVRLEKLGFWSVIALSWIVSIKKIYKFLLKGILKLSRNHKKPTLNAGL